MKKVLLFCAFFLLTGNLFASAERYIVVFEKAPVVKIAGKKVKTKAAKAYKQQLVDEQREFANFVEKNLKGKVFGSIQTVLNAVFVEINPEQIEKIKTYPGVKYIQKEKVYKLNLDQVNMVSNNVVVYRKLGMGNLDIGRGSKIAILDTGIDISNPMFDDTGFDYPENFDPGADNEADLTNNKVIVAKNFGDDDDASDLYGHGTACAGCAAGRYVVIEQGGVVYRLKGAAPGAYLGNYKVFTKVKDLDPTSPTFGLYVVEAYISAVINGIDAAVQDGMDIISMSLGGDIGSSSADDAECQALANATEAGVVCLVAAGNEGYTYDYIYNDQGDPIGIDWDSFALAPNSVSSPGNEPSVITVGAVYNDRYYTDIYQMTLSVGDQEITDLGNGIIKCGYDTQVSVNLDSFGPAEVVDLADYTTDDFACGILDGIDLSGKVVLVKRGDCAFCEKIKHCEDAGAIGVIVYNNLAIGETDEDGRTGGVINMNVDVDPFSGCLYELHIPGYFITNEDGLALKQLLANSTEPVYMSVNHNIIFNNYPAGYKTLFSSTGPTLVDYHLKPDIAAPGQYIMAPTQDDIESTNDFPTMFSSTGFGETQGTSFSTPYTAGIVAAFKALNPDLSPEEIKGIICSTGRFGHDIYQAFMGLSNVRVTNGYAIPPFLGGGLVDMANAVDAKLTVMPNNISFGNVDVAAKTKGSISKTFTVKNISGKTISFYPSLLKIVDNSEVNASLNTTSKITLNPGETADITIIANYTSAAASHLMGFVLLYDNYGNEYKIPYYGRFVTADVLNLTDGGDADGDGANNAAEKRAWADPYLTDTDGDGMSDGDEINGYTVGGTTYYFNPANATSYYYNPANDTDLTVETYLPVFVNEYDSDAFVRSYVFISNPHPEDVYVKVVPMSMGGMPITTIRTQKIPGMGWLKVQIDETMSGGTIGWVLVKSSNTVHAVFNAEEVDYDWKKPGKEENFYIETSAAYAATSKTYSSVYVPHIAEQVNQWETDVFIASPNDTVTPYFEVPGKSPVSLESIERYGMGAYDVVADIFNGSFPYDAADSKYWWGAIGGNGGSFVAVETLMQDRFTDDSTDTPFMFQLGALLLTDETSNSLIIPHVDTHWLWWTGVVINNVSANDITVTFTPYDNDGNELTPVSFTLGANSKAVNLVQGFWTANGETYPDGVSWIKITATGPITGYELFGIDPTKGTENNGEDALAGVRAIVNPSTVLTFPYVFTKTDTEWCGLVVINPNENAASLTIVAYNALGEEVGTLSKELGPNQKWVGVVDSNLIPGLTDDVKWILVESNIPVGGFVLFGDDARYYMSGYQAISNAE